MIRITISNSKRKQLEKMAANAHKTGDLRTVKRITAILKVSEGYLQKDIAEILDVSTESIRIWIKKYLSEGVEGLRAKKSTGRKPKLTKTQKKELGKIIDDGPLKAGFSAACWRSPMIQQVIYRNSMYFIAFIILVSC